MMSLDALRAAWAQDDEAKMALARTAGPRGWLLRADGSAAAVLTTGRLLPLTPPRGGEL